MSNKQALLLFITASIFNTCAWITSKFVEVPDVDSNIGMAYAILAILSIIIDLFLIAFGSAWLWDRLAK